MEKEIENSISEMLLYKCGLAANDMVIQNITDFIRAELINYTKFLSENRVNPTIHNVEALLDQYFRTIKNNN